jgi:acetyl-CoA carboxylase, biotin carboxylase subunit
VIGKVLVADRGESALRIVRCCRTLGIEAVVAHSTADREHDYVRLADEAVCIGPAPIDQSYRHVAAIISAAELTGADAIHPGTGPLAASADFAEAVETSRFRFIGAGPALLRLAADPERARAAMREVGVPGVPFHAGVPSTPGEIAALGRHVGFPLILKSGAGAAGHVRVVHSPAVLLLALNQMESERGRGGAREPIRIERYLEDARQIEVQVLGDVSGRCIAAGSRDCSVRHERREMLAEAPAAGIPAGDLDDVTGRCAEACRRLGLRGLATVRLLHDAGRFHFLSLSPRLDPANSVTEEACAADLVAAQIFAAAGEELPMRAADFAPRGHAILCHVFAEHPFRFTPATGRIVGWTMPGGPGIRVDSHCREGTQVNPHYPGLLANLVARGDSRDEAIARMQRALAETTVDGVRTNLDLYRGIMDDDGYRRGAVHIGYLDQEIAKRYRPKRRPRGR